MAMVPIRQPAFLDLLHPPFDSWWQRCLNYFFSRWTHSWPRAEAIIDRAKAEEAVDSESGRRLGWKPVLFYTYHVDGDTYSGEAEGEPWTYDWLTASEVAKSMEGDSLPIRYKPDSPSRSVYLPSDGGPPQFIPARPDPKSGLVIVSLK
jgi:uncharacterized protein DUF3592